jgi:uncharacterized protein with ATP-grasp and redox domains
MRSRLECIPCFFGQALRGARVAGLDHERTRQLLEELGRRLPEMDPALPPPVNAPILYRRLAELSGRPDPFAEVKRRHTELALGLLPLMRRHVEASGDPLDAALRVAAAGNVIDLGALAEVDDMGVALERAVTAEHQRWDLEPLRDRLARARALLVVGDNAGETVFDRVLLEVVAELYPGVERFVSVRGGPTINDATAEDAVAAGLDRVAVVVSTGIDLPGVVPERSSAEMRRLLDHADVVVAKGQGNFETLAEAYRELFFVLSVKCRVVSEVLGLPEGASALVHHPGA